MSSQGRDIHFFKRIEDEILRIGALRIPRSFVTKYWEGISNPALFLLPNGDRWAMDWKNVDGDVWLNDEWKIFANFYHLDLDHYLVFRYVGESKFHVVILDQNCLEMEYPLMEETSASDQSQRTKVHADDIDNAMSKGKGIQSEELLENTKSNSAFQRANAFSSENRFFVRQMHSSYIKRDFMTMPGDFITEQEEKEVEYITLWINERNWDVKFYPNRTSAQVMFSSGWLEFVKDNNLKIGDACVFEKIMKPGISFRVVIYHGEEPNPSMVPDSELRGSINNNMTDNHFSFSIRSTEFYYKNIPRTFLRNHGIDNANEATLLMGHRRWNVKIDTSGRFTSGWSIFTRECELKTRDICQFELIDKKDVVFKVTITKA